MPLKPGWKRGVAVWTFLVVVTAGIGYYQRTTGPTYPNAVFVQLQDSAVKGKLVRTHAGVGDAVVEVDAPGEAVLGTVVWRRFPTEDPWSHISMVRSGNRLWAQLPHQPSAGKLEYTVRVAEGARQATLPEDGSAVIRFRNDVPAWVLIPHILCMFLGLLFGLRTMLAAIQRDESLLRWCRWTVAFMIPGGLLLGPIVQKYAFDAYWTGWPLGEDLTDTKTLLAVVAWCVAWWMAAKQPLRARYYVLAATIVMLTVYLIPHSVRGSQIDWSKMPPPVTAPASTPAP